MRHFDLLGHSTATAMLILVSAGVASAQSGKLDAPNTRLYLDQAWKPADRNLFYTTSQGSQMMPYDWFLALERPDSETPFRADDLARFGYLSNRDKTNNPDRLPVGFVKDSADTGDWIGMNCSACHTNQINFAGRTLQIDGAPADADMHALIDELAQALAQTAVSKSDPKFQRFARKVLPPEPTSTEEDKLFAALKEFSAYFTQFVKDSTPPQPWGRARLDAFGMIFNRVTSIDLNMPENSHLPNAPVSYPFLWDTHYHNVVQWNGSAPNLTPVERLARNVGEVLGVFARTDIKKTVLSPLYFKTSAKRDNQLLLEQLLSYLRSPVWPRQWAPIDANKAAAGKILYTAYCVTCHTITPRNKPLGPMNVVMTPQSVVRTDVTMAQNAQDLRSKTGFLAGVRMPPFIGKPLEDDVPSVELVFAVVVGALLEPMDVPVLTSVDSNTRTFVNSVKSSGPGGLSKVLKAAKNNVKNDPNVELLQAAKNLIDKEKKNTNDLAYKARPLDGIWATAPYLHNGSIPNLYQLLLPAGQRVKTFYVGTREFDPVNVGFKTEKTDGAFLLDTSLPGNSNAGHDSTAYGTDKLTDEQRWQLVEYLKTL
jgi:mono/diheme cytochrome c family protein